MAEWTETYRGVVAAWECDIVEHFTIAYYFDRFADATVTLLELAGMDGTVMMAAQEAPARLVTTFQHELRAGAAFHMTSAVTGVDGDTLSMGHQVIDSTSGKTITWVAETMRLPRETTSAHRAKLASLVQPWTGPEVPAPTPSPKAAGPMTLRDRVKAWEVEERGVLALPNFVHRFSAAGMQFLTSVGMTGNWMLDNRRGFSTFLLDMQFTGKAPVSGRLVNVTTTPVHLGNTSLRYVHRMTDGLGNEVATMVQAGVLLDLDKRRPTQMPADIRERITRLLQAGA